MDVRRCGAGLLLLCGCFVALAVSNRGVAKAKSKSYGAAAQSQSMPVTLVVPLFVSNGEFRSTLVLVNATNLNTYADVLMRAADGTEIAQERVKFAPHSQQRLDVGAALMAAHSAATKGSIVIMPSSIAAQTGIAAQLSITYFGTWPMNYIDEEVAMPAMSVSHELRAVADPGEGRLLVSLASLSSAMQRVTASCFGDGRAISNHIELAPDATYVGYLCDEGAEDASDSDAALARSADKRPATGISLTSDAPPGSFAAFALAPHHGRNDEFFSSVPFADPMMMMSPETVFTGVPVGAADALPGNSYVPEVSLANFSAKPAHVKIQYARTSAGVPETSDARDVTVRAGSSTSVDLPGLDGDPELQDSFVVSSDAAPGDLLAKLASKSDDGIREVELMGKDQMDPQNGGNHPWSIEEGSDSILLLFNADTNPQYFNVLISGKGTSWQKAYHLQPMETKAIGIRGLVERSTKGDNGVVLPRNVEEGQVDWYVPNPNAGRGRILETNPGLSMARSFSCGGQIEICKASVTDDSSVDYSDTDSSYATISTEVCLDFCTGPPEGDGGSGYTYDWLSHESTVASISGSAGANPVAVYGASLGSTSLEGEVSDAYCHLQVSPPVKVTPNITSISPAQGPVTMTVFGVTIAGAGFGSSPTVNAPSGITVDLLSASNSQITVNLAISSSAAPGNQSISVSASGQTSNDMNFFVQVPTSVAVLNTVSQGAGSCPSGQAGWQRVVTLQLRDQEGSAIQYSGFTVSDQISGGSPNSCGLSSFHTGSSSTDSNGSWTDTYSICSTVCPNNGTCQTDATQTWTANGIMLARTVPIVYGCNSITVNGN